MCMKRFLEYVENSDKIGLYFFLISTYNRIKMSFYLTNFS